MQTISTNQGVHVHADMHELDRIRQQLTASQLALWGDHSSHIAAMLGLTNNEIADVILNDCGLAVWAVANPELGASIVLGLTAIWSQLANLNAMCNLVETKYQAGELTIDRKIGLEHQLLEYAATGRFWSKLGLATDEPKGTAGSTSGTAGSTSATAPIIQPPTDCLPPRPVSEVLPPKPIKVPVANPIGRPIAEPIGGQISGLGHGSNLSELQDSKQLQSAASYKGNYAQN